MGFNNLTNEKSILVLLGDTPLCPKCEKPCGNSYTGYKKWFWMCFECMTWGKWLEDVDRIGRTWMVKSYSGTLNKDECTGRWTYETSYFSTLHSRCIEEQYQEWVDKLTRQEIVGDG